MKQVVKKCMEIHKKIEQWVGIPVSMGIGETKTLAKAANAIAKTKQDGVFELISPDALESNLKQFPVEELWGVGRGFRSRLAILGIYSAWQFRQADPGYIRKKLGMMGERMVYELCGISCLSLEEAVQSKQSITCSRSFGQALTEVEPIAEAVATHTASACIKLREQNFYAQAMQIFLEASAASGFRHREYQGVTLSFPMPMNDAGKMISIAKSGLPRLFQKGRRYKKAGVIVMGLISEEQLGLDLFMNPIDPKRHRLAETVDLINEQMGKRALFYAATGIEQKWRMQSGNRSRRYTSCWDELATVFAKDDSLFF